MVDVKTGKVELLRVATALSVLSLFAVAPTFGFMYGTCAFTSGSFTVVSPLELALLSLGTRTIIVGGQWRNWEKYAILLAVLAADLLFGFSIPYLSSPRRCLQDCIVFHFTWKCGSGHYGIVPDLRDGLDCHPYGEIMVQHHLPSRDSDQQPKHHESHKAKGRPRNIHRLRLQLFELRKDVSDANQRNEGQQMDDDGMQQVPEMLGELSYQSHQDHSSGKANMDAQLDRPLNPVSPSHKP